VVAAVGQDDALGGLDVRLLGPQNPPAHTPDPFPSAPRRAYLA
jgi:hypothetical protein